jgi:SAM-dependent methyltransferase
MDQCPNCRCVARHRAVANLLNDRRLDSCSLALDLGGDGAMFRSKVPRLISVDVNYRQVDLLADLVRLPIRDNTVQLILCLDVLEHVENDLAATHEMYRVLEDRGTAILTFSCWGNSGPSKTPSEAGLSEWHLNMDGTWTARCYRYYTNQSALSLLNNAGFKALLVSCTDSRLGVTGSDVIVATKYLDGLDR